MKEYVILTSLGVMFISKMRPLDMLYIKLVEATNDEMLFKNCTDYINEFGLYNVRFTFNKPTIFFLLISFNFNQFRHVIS